MEIEHKDIVRQETFCMIDGIEFEEPKIFADYLLVGVLGICLIILLPLWIIPYLFGRAFKKVSKVKTIQKTRRLLKCPACKLHTLKGEYKQVKCTNCGFYRYFEDKEMGIKND